MTQAAKIPFFTRLYLRAPMFCPTNVVIAILKHCPAFYSLLLYPFISIPFCHSFYSAPYSAAPASLRSFLMLRAYMAPPAASQNTVYRAVPASWGQAASQPIPFRFTAFNSTAILAMGENILEAMLSHFGIK